MAYAVSRCVVFVMDSIFCRSLQFTEVSFPHECQHEALVAIPSSFYQVAFCNLHDSEVMEAEMMEVIEVEIEEVIDTPINEFNMEAILSCSSQDAIFVAAAIMEHSLSAVVVAGVAEEFSTLYAARCTAGCPSSLS